MKVKVYSGLKYCHFCFLYFNEFKKYLESVELIKLSNEELLNLVTPEYIKHNKGLPIIYVNETLINRYELIKENNINYKNRIKSIVKIIINKI